MSKPLEKERRKSSINFINFRRFHFLDRSRESRRRINHPPSALYSVVGEKLRVGTPRALQCALFCGGPRCRYEVPQPGTAIQGLYSDW
ncbi:protein tyrosine phosphatase domain-containing protein 1-like [Helicoverpa zea]|uniref:protein tyrosine phosphatase domain-containing protein 1-like n=1 Tax=Helicoverpa zea TaxID=7113 RepID=UPI001F57AE1E|nr:protein tyrosine phosphatase domain-containing protein 1-like [Helicoverpa zea]